MYKALCEQVSLPESESLGFEERLGLLLDREITEREDRRMQTRLRQAKLKQQACIEDIDYRTPRGLDKTLMLQLASCRWLHERLNLIINGPTGVGKTWIACACPQGLPRSLHGAVPAPTTAARGTGLGTCRRTLHQAHDQLCQDRSDHPR
jgi:DNA replication protein DnaC